jgi:tRNA-dihydrouridine synthase
MNFWAELPKPFFVLAPMDDVTDTVFRRVVAGCARPDVFFTEFASVDGFQSPGRSVVEKKLRFYPEEQPLIAQIWGINPDNFYKTARELADRGYAGIDLNMGCPVKNVIKLGACSALMHNRELAHEIITRTKEAAGSLPVSIKTRIGSKDYDESWLQFLLEQQPAALTVHFRSVRELSKVPADWDLADRLVSLRNTISPSTILIGNGDVLSRSQGEDLANSCGMDGVMIGRGIFHDPFAFSRATPWPAMPAEERIKVYAKHIRLFAEEWGADKNPAVLKKFAKIYINGFEGAKDLREKLMALSTTSELLKLLST